MDYLTAIKILEKEFIVTPKTIDGKITRWNICDNMDIDFDIWSEKDLIEYAEEIKENSK